MLFDANHQKQASVECTSRPGGENSVDSSPPRRGREEICGNLRYEYSPNNPMPPRHLNHLPGRYASRAQPLKAPHATATSPRHDTANCGVAASEANPGKDLNTKSPSLSRTCSFRKSNLENNNPHTVHCTPLEASRSQTDRAMHAPRGI
jgi:hypothetical protein